MKKLKLILLILISCYFTFSQNRMTIAVYSLTSNNVISEEEAQILTNHLRASVINYPQYNLLDRSQMNEILKEQGFQQSGCTSNECVIEAGQLLGVQKMLTGSVGKFGKLFTIELRIIDVETGRIELTATHNFQGELEKLLTDAIPAALEKLLGSPVINQLPDNVTSLTIESRPEGADIYLNGQNIGTTPYTYNNINSGIYDIKIKKPGFLDYSQNFTIYPAEKRRLNAILINANGFITVTGNPIGATILIDGKPFGILPIYDKVISIGDHRLIVRQKNYASHYRRIQIQPAYTSKYEIYLNPQRINWSALRYGAGLNFFYAVNREIYAIPISIYFGYPSKSSHSLGCRMDFWKTSHYNYRINSFNLYFLYQYIPDFFKYSFLEVALGYGRKEMHHRIWNDIYDVNIYPSAQLGIFRSWPIRNKLYMNAGIQLAMYTSEYFGPRIVVNFNL